jgi:hypothetical protein
MTPVEIQFALIDELTGHPALTDDEMGMLKPARTNAEYLGTNMLSADAIATQAAFNEFGFRLRRIKDRIGGGNAVVFNQRSMKVKGPVMAQMRVVGL